MNDLRLLNIEMLYLLWVLPLLLGFFIYSVHRRRHLVKQFLGGQLQQKLVFCSPVRQWWKIVLILTGFSLLVIGLARPAWNLQQTKVTRSGRDVVFVLDVSKSMLAEDLAPNRLERAKIAINDVIANLQGDRVGLVVFAGTASVKCPLTIDYGFFRMMLEEVGTESISRGGTMIGDAVRTVLDQMFDSQQRKYQDILLITDGEDQESFPIEAAREAAEKGVRLFIVGLGDENEGKRIPIVDESGRRTFLKHQGREVWTRLDAETLRQMALATPGGRYLNVATGTIDLGEVYQQLIGSAEKREMEEETIERYEEKFQVFLVLGFILLCLEALISEQKETNGFLGFRGRDLKGSRGM